MPWFKIDDTLHSHPKTRRAGLSAMGLWSLAGSYASQYVTEGFVPDWFVTGWPAGKRRAAELVEAGLWKVGELGGELGGETGWWFHDWDHYQPSKEEVERDREHNRDRQRRFREKRREAKRNGSNAVSNAVSNGTPSRPVPTRPEQGKELEQLGEERPVPAREPSASAPTCTKHPNGDSGQPCRSCARVNEWNERAEAQAKADAAERARNCPTCEGMGFHLDDDRKPTRRKCDHRSAR